MFSGVSIGIPSQQPPIDGAADDCDAFHSNLMEVLWFQRVSREKSGKTEEFRRFFAVAHAKIIENCGNGCKIGENRQKITENR